jgi:RHH-type rel operon transcriptional repressor/antitoxin RelB
MIEDGIAALEEANLPAAVLAQVRDGTLPTREEERRRHPEPDLFSDLFADQDS